MAEVHLPRSDDAQSAHYDRIAAIYEEHYSDPTSLTYRDRFINRRLFDGIDVAGMRVLDAMCGSGQLTDYLLRHRAQVTGLDVSEAVIDRFRSKYPASEAVTASIFDTPFPDASFDCVAVSLALHHAQPHVQEAFDEITRVLRPGGWLVFAEPHRGSLMDSLRRLWYRFDPYFEENEQAIDLDRLERDNRARYEFRSRFYGGNIAYLLVYNSMIFRVPLRLKRHYSPALLWLEGVLERLQGKRTACQVIVQWRKRSPEPDPAR